MLKVNNKDSKTTSAVSVVNFEHVSHFFLSASIIDFEHVNVGF